MNVDKNLDGVCATKNCNNPINLNAKICVHCLKEKYNKILEGKSREYEKFSKPPMNNEFNFKQFMFTSIIFMSLIMFLSSIVWWIIGNAWFSYTVEDFGPIWKLMVFSILLFFSGAFFFDDGDYIPPPVKENKPKITCRVCNKSLESKPIGERVAKGTAGAAGGSAVGMIAGTIILPGFGTLIGGALGAIDGSSFGSQVRDICDSCCMLCEKKKINCTCNDIIGSCRSCSANITRFNSSNGYCSLCYDHGEDI